MYQSHFGLTSAPFALTPNTRLFHALPPHLEAIETTLAALAMGEGIIQISGEVGTGKTLVCRMLINQLPTQFELAYLPTPARSGKELRIALARELALETDGDEALLADGLQQALLARKAAGKTVVVLIDEAQALPDDALEVVRLLGNLETEQEKLLHIILLGQPELDTRLAQHHLRQFRQRITFRSCLRPLDLSETAAYIIHRLAASGCETELFHLAEIKAIWSASRGIPRLINQLCHKSLLAACSEQRQHIDRQDVLLAIRDTLGARQPRWTFPVLWGWQ
ncbi:MULTISPECIES: ExeA family protein [Photobacterium]|uniref:MSHA biogenesis protein MshM n=1 Tax=Photobacterium ganghwense TaxID=320778 RepID=A0A0J1JVT2_9GAMM|nr:MULTISPECIES: AAA family ATPase [Photobacterium]KLV06412.1 MSHA biogenesis protein MshM [Photobacterium ganghwense]PSU06776.1 MSHA biogenesis protein MshM [Photobacterium ganghwense]QSV14379.1 AAA family ATPase [Photobacterium ganghwense]